MVVQMNAIETSASEICDPCSVGNHLYCDGMGTDSSPKCHCINSIHRIEYEEGDDIYRLAGRIRGIAGLFKEAIVNISSRGPEAIALHNLDDIAARLDGLGDNLAVITHLLNNPTSAVVRGGILGVTLDTE